MIKSFSTGTGFHPIGSYLNPRTLMHSCNPSLRNPMRSIPRSRMQQQMPQTHTPCLLHRSPHPIEHNESGGSDCWIASTSQHRYRYYSARPNLSTEILRSGFQYIIGGTRCKLGHRFYRSIAQCREICTEMPGRSERETDVNVRPLFLEWFRSISGDEGFG